MAQIPMGNFGYAQPTVTRSQTVSTRVDDNSAGQLANVIGDAVGGISKDFADGIKLQADLAAKTKRNKAATFVNEFETKLQAAELDLERQHAEGTIGSDALLPAWEQTAKKLREEITPFADQLDEDTKAEYISSLESTRVNGLARFQGSALNAVKKDHQSSVTESWDSFRKNNLGNYEAASAWLDGEGGAEMQRAFGADAPEKIRKAKEQAGLDSVSIAIMNAGEDTGKLSAVLGQLQSEKAVAILDPDKRLVLTSNLQNNINTLKDRAERKAIELENKKLKIAEDTNQAFLDNIMDGATLPAEDLLAASERVKGTPYEPQFNNLVVQQTKIQEVMKQPKHVRDAFIESQEREMLASGSTKEQRAMIEGFKKASNDREELKNNDPHSFNEKMLGGEITQLDLSNPDPVSIRNRELQASAIEKETGKNPGILKPTEKKAIVQHISTLSGEQRLSYFAKLKESSGTAYSQIMKDVGADSPADALAGQMYGSGMKVKMESNTFGADKFFDSDDIALRLTRGAELMKSGRESGKMPIPDEAKFNASMMDATKGAFINQESFAKASESIKAYYAARSEQLGVYSSVVDAKIMDEAIRATTGNIVVKSNRRVLAPIGMDSESFLEKAEAAYNTENPNGTPWSRVNLMPYKNNQYMIAVGDTPVRRHNKPIIIEVK